MDKDYLTLKRASASRPSGHWYDDDYDVLCEGEVVGRIMKAAAAPVGQPWLWTLAYGHHEDRTPTHGYEATREAAMAGFRKSWQRDQPGGLPPGTGGHLVLFPRPRKGRLHALSQTRTFSAPLTNLANFFRA
jgi:hypothetical protein